MAENAAHFMLFGLSFDLHILEMTWMVMAVTVVLSIMATHNLRMVPGKLQNIFEMIISSIDSQVNASIGTRGPLFAPMFVTMLIFMLIGNLWGLIPGLSSPTSSLNTDLGIALLVIVMLHALGIYYKGGSYIKHFFEPFAPFVIIKAVEEFSKPITLSFRLFGNIVAGELIIHILPKMLPNIICEVIPGVIWLGFSVFVSVIQALIFTMLSISYLSEGVGDVED